ncbi:hypothetical protein Taro_031535, partial [Colocasia esculenta]|nr:hypothetical protein [Colocasia esculenta]
QHKPLITSSIEVSWDLYDDPRGRLGPLTTCPRGRLGSLRPHQSSRSALTTMTEIQSILEVRE